MKTHSHIKQDEKNQKPMNSGMHMDSDSMNSGMKMDMSSVASGGHMDHHAMMVEDFKKRFFISLIATVPVLFLSPMMQSFLHIDWGFTGDSLILFVISTFLFLYGGRPFVKGAKEELKQKSPAMMTLIAFAISVAYIYSSLTVFILKGSDFFWELATLIDIMLLGHWIEMKSVMGASKSLDELVKLMPQQAHLIGEDGEIEDVTVESLNKGDQVLVKPGEKIPIDGNVFDGNSEVNESMITGESIPVNIKTNDIVIGGSINGEGILKIVVEKTGEDTFLSQVVKLVKEAQESKSNTQRLADVAAKWLFYIALSAGVITAIVWALLGRDINFVMQRAVTVIVTCCPHALGLAIPLVTSVSTSIAAQNGLLIRNRAAFENARKIDTVVFDKTGTLTEGEFGVSDVVEIDITKEKLLKIAYSVEENSEHPLARGIVREAKTWNLQTEKVSDYRTIPGIGLSAIVEGEKVMMVSPGYIMSQALEYDAVKFDQLTSEGKTVIFAILNGRVVGMIALVDVIRKSAKDAVSALKEMNVESVMLTGDNEKVAINVGKAVGISKVIAQVLPQQKVEKIEEIEKKGKTVAMTGDGINDAPSLAKADLGIAIGAGTDVALETADVILVKSNPKDVVTIIKLSKAIYKKMIQNLVWATGYNVIAIPLAAGVLYQAGIMPSPAVGAILMSMSTIIVAFNARTLKIS
ncbi:MAG: copper-translocating P-type ATPase [Lachnospiraceae bacterium]